MITMTDDMLKKIELLDRLFGAMSIDQLKELTESEQIVSRLRGDEANPQILRKLVTDNEVRNGQFMTMQAELWSTKEDIKSLLKIVSQLYNPTPVPYSQDLQSLKSKLGVY